MLRPLLAILLLTVLLIPATWLDVIPSLPMQQRNKRRRPRVLLFSLLLVLFLGVAGWYALTDLIWRIPSPPGTYELALADLDGDGDLDAFLANGRNEAAEPNTVLFNNGHGRFRDSDQRLGNFESRSVALHDFDEDGDVDALAGNISWAEYFYNDGRGAFTVGDSLMMPQTRTFSIGLWRFRPAQLDGDGRTDLFLIGCCGGGIPRGPDNWEPLDPHNTVWLGAQGGFTPSGRQFGNGSTTAVALGDLDGDGDLDAFGANSTFRDPAGETLIAANAVWFNDGQGHFADSGQELGAQQSFAVALGDLDGDGDLDAFVGNRGSDEIWWNEGGGTFVNSAQELGRSMTRVVELADFDGDGDLDALAGGERQSTIWWNEEGVFRDSGQRLRYGWGQYGVASGDLDGDGSVDVIAARIDKARVWLNDGAGNLRRP